MTEEGRKQGEETVAPDNDENVDDKQRCSCYGCPPACKFCLALTVVALSVFIIVFSVGATHGFHSETPFLQASGYPVRADTIDYSYPSFTLSAGGFPVYSSSSNDSSSNAIAGVEMQWNFGLHFPPLQGWTGSVNPRYRVFWQMSIDDDPSSRIYLDERKGHASSLYFMKQSDYILVTHSSPTGSKVESYMIVGLEDEKETKKYDLKFFDSAEATLAIPSRDGSIIAGIFKETFYNDVQVRYTTFRVAFINATSRAEISATDSFRIDTIDPYMFWSTSNDIAIDGGLQFIVTDSILQQETQVIINAKDGSFIRLEGQDAAGMYSCIPYPTSSGVVNAARTKYLYVEDYFYEATNTFEELPVPDYLRCNDTGNDEA